MSKLWTSAEDKILKENLNKLIYRDIAKLLGRSPDSVGKRIDRLGLTNGQIETIEVTPKIEIINNRAEFYKEVFAIIDKTLTNYICNLKPVSSLTDYTKNKKIEIANLIISDMHIGKLNKIYYPPMQKEIETYNDAIRQRMLQRYLDSVVEIISLQKNTYYYEKLNIFLLGDLIEGDGYVFQGQEFKITKIAGNQMWDAIRDFAFLINELSKLFPKIEVFCLVGNHSMATNNRKADLPVENYLEYHIYKALELMFTVSKNTKVTITVPTSRYYSTKVYNHLFFMTHGDETGGGAKTTRIRKAKDTYINLPDEKYDVYMLGHFHSLEKDPIGDKGVLLTNGAWIPFDDYARKLYGIYTEPKQWFFSTNIRRPMTWAFELDFKGVELTKGFKL
jgi:predicted MPP superfamily phosphohydrolase